MSDFFNDNRGLICILRPKFSFWAPRSIILTVTAVMTRGTQLFEGTHLNGGDTRFCIYIFLIGRHLFLEVLK